MLSNIITDVDFVAGSVKQRRLLLLHSKCSDPAMAFCALPLLVILPCLVSVYILGWFDGFSGYP